MKPEEKKQGLFLTQEDVDAALRVVETSEVVIDSDDTEALILDEADIIDPDSEDSEYFGLLSKEDIEALLHGDLVGPRDGDAQDEIDSLLAAAGSEKGAEFFTVGGKPGKENAVQDDVERLIQKTVAGVHKKTGTVVKDAAATGSETWEGTEAVSQDDIDRLLMSAIDDPGEDAEHDLEAVMEAPEEGALVSQDDIDRLLMGDMDRIDAETETDFGGVSIESQGTPASRNDIGGLISQADLDRLMGEVFSEGDAEKTSLQSDSAPPEHISQSDINRLLKESLEEEDLSEEEEAEEPGVIDEAEATGPVILAADEAVHKSAPPVPELPPASPPRKKSIGRFKKKRLLAGVSAGIVLALTVSMMMLPGQEETVLQPRVLTFSVPLTVGAGHSMRHISGKSFYLKGFVILAPPNSAAVTYMTGDLLLDLSDASLIDLIKENEAYVRDIVYGTINRELMTRDISAIDEISLELAIRKELSRIVPRGAIERIDFERFSLT